MAGKVPGGGTLFNSSSKAHNHNDIDWSFRYDSYYKIKDLSDFYYRMRRARKITETRRRYSGDSGL
jgi:hypothetical protein